MTLQQINYALTVAKMGSMNKAAETLFVTQPSLTTAIKELEKETGITIFLRTSKGVVQTNEGTEFLVYARQVYQQYELLEEKYVVHKNVKRKFGVSTQHYSFAVKAFVEMVKKYDTLEFEFAVRETKTLDIIRDVGILKSEIGILYISSYNRKIIQKYLDEYELEFHPLTECRAYVYMYMEHPLANEKSINMEQLKNYPCLSFEQGENGSFYLSEEILSDNEYPRVIKACDRATMLNLMVGLNGYTLCSGIICEELNGGDYIVVPFEEDDDNKNSIMKIGYIVKKRCTLSEIGETYIEEVKKYLNCQI